MTAIFTFAFSKIPDISIFIPVQTQIFGKKLLIIHVAVAVCVVVIAVTR
jgi:hypothetical protein